jgi:hypothetical protein
MFYAKQTKRQAASEKRKKTTTTNSGGEEEDEEKKFTDLRLNSTEMCIEEGEQIIESSAEKFRCFNFLCKCVRLIIEFSVLRKRILLRKKKLAKLEGKHKKSLVLSLILINFLFFQHLR